MIPVDLIHRSKINKPVSFIIALTVPVGRERGWSVVHVNLEYLNVSLLDPLIQGGFLGEVI